MILILFNSLLNNDMFFEEATDETDFEIRFQDQIECTKTVLNSLKPFGLIFVFHLYFFFVTQLFEFTKIEKFCIPLG